MRPADRFRLLASETRNSALSSIQRILEAFTRQRTAWIAATEAALGVIDYLKRVAPELAAASEAPLWPLSDDFSEAQSIVLGFAFAGNGAGLFGDIKLESGH